MIAIVGGAALYYLQVYAYYSAIPASSPAAEIRLTPLVGSPEPLPVAGFEGIDAESSPLRFRGCFTTTASLAFLTETFVVYEDPTPRIAPSWFSCFDAGRIGQDLETGAAVAFLSEQGIHTGVDRVVAVYPDGRAYAWHQLEPGQGE